jgi:hypothetical protein
MWNLKENLEAEPTLLELKKRLESLGGLVDSLKSINVGFNYNQSDAKRDLVLVTDFENREGLEAYITHPAHVLVAGYVAAVTKDRVVVDYSY